MDLESLGWNPFFHQHYEHLTTQGLVPGRIVREDRQAYLTHCQHGELVARPSGKLLHEAVDRSSLPAVGDWVAIAPRPEEGQATIHAVLPRKTVFLRKVAGAGSEAQVLASNIDTVFLVSGLDQDFNVRRIERYLALAWDSGADPVIVLNKADICSNLEDSLDQLGVFGVPVHVMSAKERQGVEGLYEYLQPGKTVAMLGSSGVGKSTLMNVLLGEEHQATGSLRQGVGKGRHVTTSRELVMLPGGALLIDTPGMRELQIWGSEEGLSAAFDDIEALAGRCRFGDCRHDGEPGCAVRAALEDGTLDAARLTSYMKLQRELRYLEGRVDAKSRIAERERHRAFARRSKDREIMRSKGLVR